MATVSNEAMTLRGRTPRVLIVEDEPRWRELLVAVVPEMGYPARGVATAEEALRVMETDPHHILVLDLHLPSMGGIELFERIRTRWPATQGIILTAYGELAAAQRAIQLRIAEFLTKPCHLSDIEIALESARRLLASHQSIELNPKISGLPNATLHEAERAIIANALGRNLNNKAATARDLGISRRSLYDRLARLGFSD